MPKSPHHIEEVIDYYEKNCDVHSEKNFTTLLNTLEKFKASYQKRLIERVEKERKEIPHWADYESAADDLGFNQALDTIIHIIQEEQ